MPFPSPYRGFHAEKNQQSRVVGGYGNLQADSCIILVNEILGSTFTW